MREGGCELLYLPRHSPDMNQIEQQWYGIKQRVRKSEGTEESLQERVDEAIRQVC
ncbi:MAG: transposase [Gloeomargaritaceae cyanobacterium C42_A2020_066]|nr:transposase [Gloeomargaritaceae cyanobacterium C42_A2020_066]